MTIGGAGGLGEAPEDYPTLQCAEVKNERHRRDGTQRAKPDDSGDDTLRERDEQQEEGQRVRALETPLRHWKRCIVATEHDPTPQFR